MKGKMSLPPHLYKSGDKDMVIFGSAGREQKRDCIMRILRASISKGTSYVQ